MNWARAKERQSSLLYTLHFLILFLSNFLGIISVRMAWFMQMIRTNSKK